MEITSLLSKAHNWKSSGNNQIKNYWFKAFPADHRLITKYFTEIMEKPEKVPVWLITRISYLLQIQETASKSETINPWRA